ncbi:hypothetical protein GYA49_06635 [Candidatus Beckwithbacteria bacterium]|nr:hypothetical protein [Candidatus Beckwithbacteria bacterium]
MKKQIITTKNTYTVNGQNYANFEDLPENFQKMLEDKDQNGIPDQFDPLIAQAQEAQVNTITINGKSYNNWDEVPKNLQHLKDLPKKLKNSFPKNIPELLSQESAIESTAKSKNAFTLTIPKPSPVVLIFGLGMVITVVLVFLFS